MTWARDVYEEGALIFPCVRVQRGYRHVEDVVRMCRMCSLRAPKMWWGDYLGMLGALRIGERDLTALAHELGWETPAHHAADWFDYSEGRMTEVIRTLPVGLGTGAQRPRSVPGPPDGVAVEAVVEIRPQDATIEVDLTGCADGVPCGVNLTEATARTAAMVGVFN